MPNILFWCFVGLLLVAMILMANSLSIGYKQESDWDESGPSTKQRTLERSAAALAIIGVAGIAVLLIIYGF